MLADRPFDLAVRPDRDRVVVALAGELDCATAPAVGEAVEELRATGWERIAIDVSGLRFIDSTGLLALLGACHSDGGGTAVTGTCDALERLLSLTRLDGRLPRA